MRMKHPRWLLPVIVLAQFCCTSLWFAGNAVMQDLRVNFDLVEGAVGHLTSAVQLGFISGTLLFAILTIADRFSPSLVFLISALFGAAFNALMIYPDQGLFSLLLFRYATGFFLAGIYPVGMKIAADYYQKGLGRSLGFLVGALVLGTAFPHLLKALSFNLPWKYVLIGTSLLATAGGILIALLVPDGPYRKMSQSLDFSSFFKVFQQANFRAAAFGYFGHMWELYAFWAFVPVLLEQFIATNPSFNYNTSLGAFAIIGVGGIGCATGGYLSESFGLKRTAFLALLASGLCCLLVPFVFGLGQPILFITFLLFWGVVVVADSPLFSTLVAQNAITEIKGTALTIVNCIGFATTIVSIQVINYLSEQQIGIWIYSLLAIGPFLGLWALSKSSNH